MSQNTDQIVFGVAKAMAVLASIYFAFQGNAGSEVACFLLLAILCQMHEKD